jgi:hypothetical protein
MLEKLSEKQKRQIALYLQQREIIRKKQDLQKTFWGRIKLYLHEKLNYKL